MKTCIAALMLSALAVCSIPGTAFADHVNDIKGKAGMGATFGVMKFSNGQDWSDGSMRFSGQAVFQYGFTNSLALQFEAGGGWNNNGGTAEVDTLSVVFPVTAGALYRTQLGGSGFWPHLGAGGGIYIMGVKDTYRSWAKAPDTDETMIWQGWGGYGKIGTDYFFSESISMNFDLVGHYISSNEGDRFGDRFGDENVSFYQFRTGVNYFFNIGSGGGISDEEIEGDEDADL